MVGRATGIRRSHSEGTADQLVAALLAFVGQVVFSHLSVIRLVAFDAHLFLDCYHVESVLIDVGPRQAGANAARS